MSRALVDRSPAWSVNGAAPDIAPLIPLLQRRRFVDVRPWVVTAYPIEVTEVPDDVTRLASRADLDALVELYSTFEFVGGLTAWQLRTMLRHLLDRHYVIVVEWPGDDARFAGAVAITTRTRRYGVLDLLTVVPDHRGAGWSWALVAHAQSIGNALGIAGIAALAGSNPMDLDAHVRRRPVRRGRTGADGDGSAASVACAPSTVVGNRCSREHRSGSANRATHRRTHRTGSKVDARTRTERRPRGPPLPTEFLMGQLIEPWPLPLWLLLRNCRSSRFHTLSGFNSRSLVLHVWVLPPAVDHLASPLHSL